MRHRVQGTAIGRDTQHRQALVRNLLASLFQNGSIETTELKAKVVKRMADKVITKGKPGTVAARRTLEKFFGQRQIVNHIMESVVPALTDRTSGFTRMVRLGRRRGDDASMVKIELVSVPLARAEKPAAKAKAAKPAVAAKKATKAAQPEEKQDKQSKADSANQQTKASSAKKTVAKTAAKKPAAKAKTAKPKTK